MFLKDKKKKQKNPGCEKCSFYFKKEDSLCEYRHRCRHNPVFVEDSVVGRFPEYSICRRKNEFLKCKHFKQKDSE